MLLDGKKILVTGVLTDDSIAFSVAKVAQESGAEIVLTGVGRALSLTQRIARRLDPVPDVLEMDVNDDTQIAAVAADLEKRWGRLDGLLHAIAFAPQDAMGGGFLDTPWESAATAFQTSAFSLKALTAGMLPLLKVSGASGGASVVSWTSTRASRGRSTTGWAWPRPVWNPSPATSPGTWARTTSGSTPSRPDQFARWRARTSRLRPAGRPLGGAGSTGLGRQQFHARWPDGLLPAQRLGDADHRRADPR